MTLADVTKGLLRSISLAAYVGGIATIVPLLLYGMLWWTALGMPDRLNPELDMYASIWTVLALLGAAVNMRLGHLNFREFQARRSVVAAVISLTAVVGCPEWMY